MSATTASSRFTVRFRVGPFPVAITPGFWLLGLVLLPFGSPLLVLVLLSGILVSVLVHELGHAFACWVFGLPAQISLHLLGGTTTHPGEVGRRGRILISLAGPCAGFSFGALIYLLLPLLRWPAERWGLTTLLSFREALLWMNFGWGAANLLPILPLDGGHVLEHTLGPRRRTTALAIATATALAASVLAVVFGYWLALIYLLPMAWENGRTWLQARQQVQLRRWLDGEQDRARDRLFRMVGGDERPEASSSGAPNRVPPPPARPKVKPAPPPPAPEPADPRPDFEEAKRLARQGQTKEAAQALRRAFKKGFDDLDALNSDPDLEPVRREPEIAALLDPMGLRGGR
ncbi:MAG TPA: M50 family metallopeptidase [Myxococcaceae bacterium]|nr:M50 family metallopeptidase [Myxococcaceae bacterium]